MKHFTEGIHGDHCLQDIPKGQASKTIELLQAFHRIRRVNFTDLLEVTPAEFFVLQIIERYEQQHPQQQGIYVSRIAGKARMASSQVSRMLKGLEERELIGRSVDLKDRRNTYVFLTGKGKEITGRTKTAMEDYVGRVMKAFGEERVEELIDLCNKMADVMERELENSRKEQTRNETERMTKTDGKNI